MSNETLTDLNTNTLIGYTDKRGKAWHYRAQDQGVEPNHYEGAIPVADVRRRLFGWKALEADITATALTSDGVITATDPNRKAIVRSDTADILGVFKSGYQVHDYDEWLISNVENILDADLAIGSAGLLKKGAVAWVQVEMEDTVEVEGVEFRPFLTAATSLDGSLATTYLTGAQVVVCDNTLSVAMGDYAQRFKVRHSVNSLKRLGEAREALNIVHKTADAFAEAVGELTRTTVTDSDWYRFLEAHAPIEKDGPKATETRRQRLRDELNQLYRHDERVAPWQGTAYGVLSAVNTHTHHLRQVRGASRVERNMERAVKGGVDKLDAETLKTLDLVLA